MATLGDLLAGREEVGRQRPWPRFAADAALWEKLASGLAEGNLGLLAIWGDTASVHAAVRDGNGHEIAVLRLDCPDGGYPSLGRSHAPAIRPE